MCPKNPANFNVDNVRVAKLLGGGLHNSTVVRGMVLKSDAVGSIKRIEKAKVSYYKPILVILFLLLFTIEEFYFGIFNFPFLFRFLLSCLFSVQKLRFSPSLCLLCYFHPFAKSILVLSYKGCYSNLFLIFCFLGG